MRTANKILVALQYWEGDRAQAAKLVNFLADLEKAHNDKADFLLVNRFDCKPLKEISILSRKFNTFTYQSPRGATGWPYGCNSLAAATITWAFRMCESGKAPLYKAIFTCEADGCPIFEDWVSRMDKAWAVANSPKPVCIAGPLVPHPAEHINGNCLINGSMENLQWMSRQLHAVKAGGWDYVLAREFKFRGWADIPTMKSYYHTRDYTVEQYHKMMADELIWVHGVKDESLIDLGRVYILGAKNAPVL